MALVFPNQELIIVPYHYTPVGTAAILEKTGQYFQNQVMLNQYHSVSYLLLSYFMRRLSPILGISNLFGIWTFFFLTKYLIPK